MSNLLYYGDNLDILRDKIRDESVDLCYIDPPFSSKRNYFQIYNNVGKEDVAQAQAFIDIWTWNELAIAGYQEITTNYQSRYTRQTIELMKGLRAVLGENPLLAYLVGMAQRVNEIQRVLKPTGSFYLHCDPTASHYLKLVLDSVFCPRSGDYLNEIVWKRTSAHSGAKRHGPVHDIILFYSKSEQFNWNVQYQPYDEQYVKSFFTHIDEKGRYWTRTDLTGPGVRNGDSSLPWRGYNPSASNRHWQPPSYFYEKYNALTGDNLANYELIVRLDKLDEIGLIHWPKKKNGVPKGKRLLEDAPGIPSQDVWTDIKGIHNISDERLGYPTQKPEALLERIIQASSNEGDTVLDAFCGCGTTVAVAQRLRRNWIGIDITYQSIAVILQRLEDSFGAAVSDSVILSGIPRDVESATALANKKDDRLRKEFEKWSVLTYSKNRAAINEKKGADRGVDGTAYMVTGTNTTDRVIFQVKSGGVKRNDIATLRGDVAREEAAIGILITLEPPTKPMRDEAAAAGTYHHELLNRDYPRLLIVTVQDIIENGARIDLPLTADVLKTATGANMEEQLPLPDC